ncbi:GFA family protein [uncultured Rhodospira sp.]|uniref:GFA family protein n=1 Tax=uncultured Rhodospira sp. TaxID=1936189 RepID=UPI00261267EF|nr:GFA family protein [uncultured Rhodospira sp.]
MQLSGSCHCGAVTFSVESAHPVPFNLCYCSICRKTAGSGGFAINLGAEAASLAVTGREHVTVYHARLEDGGESPGERHFCKHCGTALWVWDPRWPDLIHPHAGAIETPLPVPPERLHLMLAGKPDWVAGPDGPADRHFDGYPD